MKLLLVLTLIVATLQGACGGDENRAPAGGGTPSDQPTDNPPTGGEEEPEQSWSEVHEEFVNDAVAPQDCEYPWKFTVENDGHFVAGPCISGGSRVRGSITTAERTELSRRADRVARGNIEHQTCEPFTAIAEDEVRLTLPSNRTFTVWELNLTSRSFCFRNGRENANRLHEYLNTLMRKYYPRRSPQ